jgi:hypothetical protein
MKYLFIILFCLFIVHGVAFSQYYDSDYTMQLLREAKKLDDTFIKYSDLNTKKELLVKSDNYMNFYCNLSQDPVSLVSGGFSYIKHIKSLEDFFTDRDNFEQYKAIVVAIRLYTEYYELTGDKTIACHIASLYRIQKHNSLVPYFHYGFYKNDIFNFSIATPSFDYFDNLSMSCFQIDVSNNSTSPVDFSRFKFCIKTLDGNTYEDIDLEKNKEFYDQLPPMPDGYLFETLPVLATDRALKLFPSIKDERKIEKVIMQDKSSDFKIEAIFFENMKEFSQ